MSRAMRRARGSSASRRRRTPVRPRGDGGMRVPWIPIVVVAGIAAVVGLIAFLVWQTTKPASNRFAAACEMEKDPAPNLPGEFVDLGQVYADGSTPACYANPDGPNTNAHVTRDVDYSTQGLPPAGGPHWGASGCGEDPRNAPAFCGPAPWGIYRDPWAAETLVHNMEHGGAVIWYNSADTAVRDQLEDWVEDESGGKLLIMSPYPDLPPETIALTGWGRRDRFPVSDMTEDRVKDFIREIGCRFDPENIC